MLSQKQTIPQTSLFPNYAYWKHVMEWGGMAQNTVYYSWRAFYKMHKYQHKLNVWVCMQEYSLMLIMFKAGGPLGKKWLSGLEVMQRRSSTLNELDWAQ